LDQPLLFHPVPPFFQVDPFHLYDPSVLFVPETLLDLSDPVHQVFPEIQAFQGDQELQPHQQDLGFLSGLEVPPVLGALGLLEPPASQEGQVVRCLP